MLDNSSVMTAQLRTDRLLIAYRFVVYAARMKGQMWSMQEVMEVQGTHALVAARESSLGSTGGIPRAMALKMPRWSSSPSAITMQFSEWQK